jgi:hypothetical protein
MVVGFNPTEIETLTSKPVPTIGTLLSSLTIAPKSVELITTPKSALTPVGQGLEQVQIPLHHQKYLLY